eukprot:6692057-Prymnesium_polylepis.1
MWRRDLARSVARRQPDLARTRVCGRVHCRVQRGAAPPAAAALLLPPRQHDCRLHACALDLLRNAQACRLLRIGAL